jgi:hypothetical protein
VSSHRPIAREEAVLRTLMGATRSSLYNSLAWLQNNLESEKRFFKVVSCYDKEWDSPGSLKKANRWLISIS